MEYTVQKLAKLSGVSSRTLRYYDQIGLLKPARINSSGYRIYGEKEVNRLQQILFYRQMALKLEEIQEILDSSEFDYQKALANHYQQLLEKRKQLDFLLETVAKTLDYYKGEKEMTDTEKFAAFKAEKIAENIEKYRTELKEKYSAEDITAANEQWKNMSAMQYEEAQAAEETLIETLNKLLEKNEKLQLPDDLAEKVFESHKKWLTITAPFYSAKYHKNLALLYVEDQRFVSYYNQKTNSDSVQLLKQIIDYYAK